MKRFAAQLLVFPLFSCFMLAAGPSFAVDLGTEMGVEDDLSVFGTQGTVPDPDLEIKGFSIFGSTNVATFISTAPGNTVFNGAVQVSSDVYVIGKSTFIGNVYLPNAGSVFVNDGASGQLLQKSAAGNLSWTNSSAIGDDLGDHTATTTLNLSGFGIDNVSTITYKANVFMSSATAAQLGGVYISTNMYIVGVTSAAKYYGDGSALTGIAGTDNLGNHTATAVLQMGNYGINTSSDITATRYQIAGSTVLALLPGTGSLGVGLDVGRVNSGTNNTFVGYQSGYSNTTGMYNSFYGYRAGYTNTTGSNNTFLSGASGRYNSSGTMNTFVGYGAGYNITTGEYNTFAGALTGYSNRTGSANILFGYRAGYNGVTAISYSSSTVLGYQAGYNLTSGSDNIFLGWQAGYNVNTGTGNIVIGYDKGTSVPTANNELNIGGVLYGDLSAKTIGISTRIPEAALDIVSTGTASNQFAQIWRDGGGVIKGSMSATGVMMAVKFVGDGTGLTGVPGDNLGNHTATTNLNLSNRDIISVSTISVSTITTAGAGVVFSTNVYVMKGNVGIGTDNPTDRLMIYTPGATYANISGVGNVDNYSGLALTAAGSGKQWTFLHRAAAGEVNNFMIQEYNGTTYSGRLSIAPGGKVGIGNVYPGARLDVKQDSADSYALRVSSNDSTVMLVVQSSGAVGIGDTAPATKFMIRNTTDDFMRMTRTGVSAWTQGVNSSANFFLKDVDAGTVSLMAQYGTGRIGVGTATPATRFDVTNGSITTRGTDAGLVLENTNRVISPEMSSALHAGIKVSTHMYVVGFTSATKYYGDGSALTGVPGDNLGNHVATTTLQMGAYGINTSSNVSAARYQIAGSTVLAVLPGAYSMGFGVDAGALSQADYNTFAGHSAGNNTNTGVRNTFVGALSGSYNTGGARNSYLGAYSGFMNTAGVDNTALGYLAGYSNTGSNNAFVGGEAGRYNTTGWNNAFVGYQSGFLNTTGNVNAFVGYQSGYTNSTGSYNSFFGTGAGYNTLVDNNSFFGYRAGYSNISGWSNVFLGAESGYNTISGNNAFMGYQSGFLNTTGWSNSFVGYNAGYSNTTGGVNAYVGYRAGRDSNGSYNAFLGADSGYKTTGNNNAIVGYGAGYSNTTGWGNTFMGAEAGYNAIGSNNTFLGRRAGYALTSGNNNIVIGYDQNAPSAAVSDQLNIGGVLYGDLAAKTIGISTRVPEAALDIVSTGTANTQFAQIWRDSGGTIKASLSAAGDMNAVRYQIAGSTVLAVYNANSVLVGNNAGNSSSGSSNVFVGSDAGANNTSGSDNTFVGRNAGVYHYTGTKNTFIGSGAGYYTNAGENTYVGYWAGMWNSRTGRTYVGSMAGWNSTSGGDTFVGVNAGYDITTGSGNVLMGGNTGRYIQTGAANTILGTSAGYGATGQSFSSSTLVGYKSGYSLTTGNDNIFLGWQAGYTVTSGTGNIVIGYNKTTPAAGTNNHLNIGGVLYGDLSTGRIGISTNAPVATLDVKGDARISRYMTQAADTGITVTAADFGKTITVNSASAQTVTLPSVTSADIGATITVLKLGAGKVTIQAAASTYIADSAAAGTIYNSAVSPVYAAITLRLATSTTWIPVSGSGAWITTQ